ncbi:MAG: hypothetical protein K6U11_11885, partial [bacterium]|nr:hypothetical protein [bacterium]
LNSSRETKGILLSFTSIPLPCGLSTSPNFKYGEHLFHPRDDVRLKTKPTRPKSIMKLIF